MARLLPDARIFQRAARWWPSAESMPLPLKVSVVIPCFNAVGFVGATLRSVLAQGDELLEVIVVDDGSTDGSADLVAREFTGVKLLRQANAGVAAARNLGIRHAVGDWVAFLDADDLWLPGKLRAQRELLQQHPQARMAYTAWKVWVSSEPEPDAVWLQDALRGEHEPSRWAGPSGWIYPELLLDCHVWTSTVLAQRELLSELQGFDASLRIGEDYDLWLRASRLTPIVRAPQPLALYRQHPGNVTKRVPAANHKGETVMRALQRWGYASPDGRTASRAAVGRGLARSWGDFAGAQLLAGHHELARRAALTAVRTDPRLMLGWTVLAKSIMGSTALRAKPRA